MIRIVFDGVTVDWCVTCKSNKTMAEDRIGMLDMFQRRTLLQCKVTLLSKMMKNINS